MLIGRKEENGIIECLYESSTILSSKYDASNKLLEIVFKNGNKYNYYGVANNHYVRFETDESQGKVLISHIKQYRCEKQSSVNINEITSKFILEINEPDEYGDYVKLLNTVNKKDITKETVLLIMEKSIEILKKIK